MRHNPPPVAPQATLRVVPDTDELSRARVRAAERALLRVAPKRTFVIVDGDDRPPAPAGISGYVRSDAAAGVATVVAALSPLTTTG